ncbi:MAG: CDP-diacylglycerol/serineO-phosphatidyltransfera se [Bacteroidetes bacterium]|jgi:CDP-diacylglycerol--serine O-phosphatidyltransferase|nr:CDP-diacylglycerol/serineO-phosphatidyltransfera se [Bacteroidota bacterium]
MIKRNIPNTITLGNLLCGCLAIVKAFEGDLVWAAYLVGIAAVLDFFDGFIARLLKVTSPIGKDLDSLSDMVTFGVVPGIIMFLLLGKGYIAFIIPILSCVRLAKFNNDSRQSESFIGVPTPAFAILVCSLPLIKEFHPESFFITAVKDNPWLLIVLCFCSLLLVAPIPLFALKFKQFKWKGNEIRYIFLLFSVVVLSLLQFIGIPIVIISYVLFSIVNNIIKKQKV